MAINEFMFNIKKFSSNANTKSWLYWDLIGKEGMKESVNTHVARLKLFKFSEANENN